MASPVKTTLNDAGQWEVRANDEHDTLLGTFAAQVCRDLFMQAVFGICLESDHEIVPVVASSETPMNRALAA